jgi:hypothetical protein
MDFMNAAQVLQSAFGGAHRWFQGTIEGLTAEQANTVPEGIAHPIGSQIAHILHSEDGMIGMLEGTPPLWQSEGWGEKLGLEMLMSQTAESSRAYRCDPAQLEEYGKAVFARTDAYLAGLSDEDLDRPHDLSAWGMGEVPVGQILTTMTLGNTYAHTGEISALKGTQGLKGYPF